MTHFEAASAITPLEPGSYRVNVPDGWQQGRGAFGGLVLGALARAMRAAEPDAARTLRALTGDLCGPAVPGEAAVRVEVLRRGKNLTNVDARFVANGEVIARASGVLAASKGVAPTPIRAGSVIPPGTGAPSLPGHADVAALDTGLPGMPIFTQHLEYRPIDLPFTGGKEPIARGFVRFREPPRVLDEAAMIGLLDAWWPALFTVEAMPRVVATVSFTAELVADVTPLDPATPLAYQGRVIAERDGFFVELRELWSGETLLAMNQQTFAILN